MSEPIPLARQLPEVVAGGRVHLERWDERHLDDVHGLVERSFEELSAFLPWARAPLTKDDERRDLANATRQWREGLMVGWVLLEDGIARGMVGLHRRGGPDELEIGYWLGTEATGRGLMTEAAAMATDVAFSIEGIEVVEITHDQANARSGAIPERLGYRRVAAYTRPPSARLESGVKVRWQVTRAQWAARRAAARGGAG